MSNTNEDTATIEYVESGDTQRLSSAQEFRREQYRLACERDPVSVAAYEREVERRRASRVANELARTERSVS